MGKRKEEVLRHRNGVFKISIEWRDEDEDTVIASAEETRVLQFLFKKEHLPMAESRILDAMDSIQDPLRIELVGYVNSLIAEEYKDEETDEPLTDPIPIGDNEET